MASPAAYQPPVERTVSRRRGHHRGGGGIGLLLVLLVLVALIGAGFVYGRQYLFPDDWDADTKPYAEAVESVRGAPIAEPFAVVPEPPGVYEDTHDADFFGDWHLDLPLWRAFGLADGSTSSANLGQQVSQRPAAYYVVEDHQVHRVDRRSSSADPEITAAVAAAVLDQEYRWSLALDGATLDRDAVVRALVATEAQRIQMSSEFGGPIPSPGAQAPGLPALLDHRLVAPVLYAEIIGPPASDDESRLASVETFGAQLSGSTVLPIGTAPTLGEGEATAGEVVPTDRSFWYLAFASRLDAPTAHDVSQSIVSASLTPVRTPELAVCWTAVFDVSSPEAGFALGSALTTWVAAAPPESAAEVQALAQTTIQLRSCDPGMAAATTDPDIARSLLGYRAAELAVITGVAARGGGETEITLGMQLLAQSTAGDDLAALPPNTAVAAVAAEARALTTAVVEAATAELVTPDAPPAAGSPPAADPAESGG